MWMAWQELTSKKPWAPELSLSVKNRVKSFGYKLLATFLLSATLACSGQNIHFDVPDNTSQIILVTSDNWDTSHATLSRLERTTDSWRQVGPDITVQLGRNGLGWGKGIHPKAKTGVEKKEGDGKAPSGIFLLGSAFGYAEQAPVNVSFDYRQADERDYYVDAVDSSDYNQWRRIPEEQENRPKSLWSSFERMRREDLMYEFGLVVEHNKTPIQPGSGSAIFLHVWLNPETATSGCTAMDKEDLLSLLRWLKTDSKPVLVQMPTSALGAFSNYSN